MPARFDRARWRPCATMGRRAGDGRAHSQAVHARATTGTPMVTGGEDDIRGDGHQQQQPGDDPGGRSARWVMPRVATRTVSMSGRPPAMPKGMKESTTSVRQQYKPAFIHAGARRTPARSTHQRALQWSGMPAVPARVNSGGRDQPHPEPRDDAPQQAKPGRAEHGDPNGGCGSMASSGSAESRMAWRSNPLQRAGIHLSFCLIGTRRAAAGRLLIREVESANSVLGGCLMVNGRWAMGDGRWAMAMGDGQWAMGDGQ